MGQTRRNFLKTAAGSGVLLVVSRVRFLDSPQAQAAVMDPPGSWKGAPGQARHRIDGLAKVTGRKIYARDFRARDLPGWPEPEQYVFILRARFADRLFAGIDLSSLPADLRPMRVVTAADLARDRIGVAEGDYPEGMYLVPEGQRPDHLGQAVALLFYPDLHTMRRAQPALMYSDAIVRAGAPAEVPAPYPYEPETSILHVVRGGEEKFAQTLGGPVHPETPGERNAAAMAYVRQISGKLESEGWNVFAETYATQCVDPMFMEPESGLAWLDRKTHTLHLVIGSQSPEYDVRSAAELFAPKDCGIDVKVAQITACYPGGGFGGRDTSILCLYLALGAAYAEGPIRILYDRWEQFQVGVKRHAATIELTMGVDDRGRFQAVRNHTILNGGGRINVSSYVAQVAGIMGAGAYDFPLADIWSRAQHTRSIVGGSMRGFGTAQVSYAVESLIDEAAASMKIDPIELRRRNLLRPDQSIVTGAPKAPPGLREMCDRAIAHPLWKSRAAEQRKRSTGDRSYGVGFALAMKNYGTGADAVLNAVAIDESGKIVVTSHAIDMGTGTATALALSTARSLGANADEVKTGEVGVFDALQLVGDFDPKPENPRWTPLVFESTKAATTSSRWVHGVEQSSLILFETGVLPAARASWGAGAASLRAEDVRWKNGSLVAPGKRPLPLAEIAQRLHRDGGVVAAMTHAFFSATWVGADWTVDGVTRRWPVDALGLQRAGKPGWELIDRRNVDVMTIESIWEGNGQTFGASACLAAVSVDRRTGEVRVERAVHFLAPGRILQRDLLEGQMEGAFAMGVGFALLEDIPAFEDGGPSGRWNLNRYHVALAGDCAIDDVEKVILPPESPDAPARGIAEVSMCPIAPAIANAVAHATGKRFRSLPITPDKVRAALA